MKPYTIFYWENSEVKRVRKWFRLADEAIAYGVSNFGLCVVIEDGTVVYPGK